ncbi:Zinc finger protein 782 [Frankliniella fusca]|uniref:Zinc finger protein 782 n=1 Tax=Frankliniella fusca TaxID=407009 RepID=A0AAE1HQX7_9NEOP|nr:Zinc finger protein 782 [Frankliniella fusca]
MEPLLEECPQCGMRDERSALRAHQDTCTGIARIGTVRPIIIVPARAPAGSPGPPAPHLEEVPDDQEMFLLI